MSLPPDAWPSPAFRFRVKIAGVEAGFAQVSGIEATIDGAGGSPAYARVSLRRGIFKDDRILWDWFDEVVADSTARRDVAIDLIDERGTSIRSWTFNDCWPARIFGPELSSTANEAAIEGVEIGFDTMTVG